MAENGLTEPHRFLSSLTSKTQQTKSWVASQDTNRWAEPLEPKEDKTASFVLVKSIRWGLCQTLAAAMVLDKMLGCLGLLKKGLLYKTR